MTADYEPAIAMFVDRSRVFINTNDHKAIVIHKTAGSSSAQNVAAWFAIDPAMSSTHFVIGQDGTVVQCVLLIDGAAGNGILDPGHDSFWDPWSDNPNYHTISIEHVDPATDNSTPVTDAQKEASFALVSSLCQKYSIVAEHIKPHSSLQPTNRARYPGNYPFDELVAFIAGGGNVSIDLSNPTIARFFTDDGHGNWQRKGSSPPIIITGGILQWYKTVQTASLCGFYYGLPVDNNVQATDSSGNVVPNAWIQHFERAIVVYDPQRKLESPPGVSGTCYLKRIDDLYKPKPTPAPAQPS